MCGSILRLTYHELQAQKERGETGAKAIFEDIMSENFSKLIKNNNNNPLIKKSWQMPSSINTKQITPRYVTVSLLKIKNKDKNLKSNY